MLHNFAIIRTLGDRGLQIVITVLIVAVLQIIVRTTIARLVHGVVNRHKRHQLVVESEADQRKRESTLVSVFRTASALILWLIAVILILAELHVNIAALLTGAGVVGVVIGFGAQSTINNYLAGIFIIMENQYRVGDIVSVNGSLVGQPGVSGVVEDISIRITKLRDLDGNLHIVRNGDAGVITNMSFHFANINVDIGVGYDSDIDKVEKVINEIGESMSLEDKWRPDIIEPIRFLRLDSFGESSIIVKSVGKVKPARQWDVAGEFRRRIKVAFAKNGIEIPFPQRVVHQAKVKNKKEQS